MPVMSAETALASLGCPCQSLAFGAEVEDKFVPVIIHNSLGCAEDKSIIAIGGQLEHLGII